ncbi:oxygenase MpaB family protein [Actinokineospora pegani]|uniref:oxygenase MpaB family protein n=1 Tax=Actinokineospora pegani TaxID=2654637 RepID=UPI001F28FEB2|nr:oxygenase MpaB family protein [Actinokineospora pegani]
MLSQESVDALRHEGDPLADAVIEDLVSSGAIGEVNAVLTEFRGNAQPIPENLPARVRQYLIDTDVPPAWMDPERVAGAREFFVDDGAHVASVLSYGSMVECYAQVVPAKVLTATHRLNQPHRRLAETSQFVLNMMADDPFGDRGAFVPTIQKTRLIHAAVRHLVTGSPDWDPADGVPVCQRDLLGALLIFSVRVVHGMRRIGVSVTDAEAEDYWHVWRVAGAMLGIREDVLPWSFAEADALNRAMLDPYFAPSPEGTALTGEILALYQDFVPGKVFDGVVPAMVRQTIGHEVADMVGVPRSPGWGRVVGGGARVMRALERVEDNNKAARVVLDKAGGLLVKVSARVLTGGRSAPLDIPAGLRGCPMS